jgi:hypothetical protein
MRNLSAAWSVLAGLHAFLSAVVVVLFLGPVAATLATTLGLPAGRAPIEMAVPAAVIGAITWWAIAERQRRYRYGLGALFGVSVAVLTVLFWVLVFVAVWGPRLVLSGWFVVALVLAVTAVAGLLTGLLLMHARRQLMARSMTDR